ncbi:zinc finger MYM-type protein 1-like [Metopolophium dirhodum]|uniref:zinc finger MYM-type protein 1-like n=1 Tax=Metopolophium dirhodum TaxID=44670 RepID=UPI0029903111|nr:zinc finger MYM-type protein 1-like [Metopolophium dirhodum]
MIDSTCFLAQQELAFRGHDESDSSVNKGNYVELIYLMAQRDELLKTHLATSTIFTGLSGDIQNDLIQSISNVLLKQIENEIRDTPFVAIIMDETTDIVSKSQLSTVLRYINTIDGYEVVERFLGFTDVSEDRSAKALSEHVFSFISKYACEEKLIAQTYDGAAVMSGQHNGLQSLVRSKYENAIFVHCYAHKLNLVIKQSVEYIKDCKIFFSTLSGLSSFFSKSTKRVHALDNVVKKRFPSVASTRWNYNSRLIEMMVEHKLDVINLMESIIENAQNWDSETLSSAKRYVEILQSFDFNFFLKLFSIILPQATIIFEILQKKIFDISYCSKKIDDFIVYLNTVRSSFDDIWSQLEIINNEIQPQIHRSKRQRFNQVSGDPKTNYRRLFFEIIDVIINKTKERFSNLNQLQFFALLDFKKFSLYANDFSINLFNSLKQLYGKYFDLPKLRSELSVVYSTEEFQKPNVHDLLIYLKTTNLDENLPQATKLISLILTIPATSASAERSFSALKRIKNSSRNSQEQNRLSSLSMLSIEKKLLVGLKKKSTFHDEVIKAFLTKNRRIDLIYK